jgi:hypothetical protein
MTDPTTVAASVSSVSLAAFLSLWVGPHYGPYMAILFAAMAGAVWGVSAAQTVTRLDGAGLFVRYTLTAVVLVGGSTAIAGSYIDTRFDSPVELSILVAFGIAAIGGRWTEILSRLNPLGLIRPRGPDQ